MEDYPYQKDWERYKVHTRTIVFLFFLYAFLYCLSIFGQNYFSNKLIGLIMLFPFLISIFVSYRLYYWKCPKCKKHFLSGFKQDMLRNYCGNCGLKRYEGSTFYK